MPVDARKLFGSVPTTTAASNASQERPNNLTAIYGKFNKDFLENINKMSSSTCNNGFWTCTEAVCPDPTHECEPNSAKHEGCKVW